MKCLRIELGLPLLTLEDLRYLAGGFECENLTDDPSQCHNDQHGFVMRIKRIPCFLKYTTRIRKLIALAIERKLQRKVFTNPIV